MPRTDENESSIKTLDLSLVRFLPDDRYALMCDEEELVVLAHQVPGVASVHGASVRLAAERRSRRLAIVAANDSGELGWIQLSWIPGRHRIRIGDSGFRAARRLFRGCWNLYGHHARLATIELNGWFSPELGLRGRNQIDAGGVVVTEPLIQGSDVLLAIVLLLEMLASDVPVPAAGPGG